MEGPACKNFDTADSFWHNYSSPPLKFTTYLFLLKQRHACYNDKTQQTDTSFYYSSRGTILHLSTKSCMTRLQQSLTRGRLTLSYM